MTTLNYSSEHINRLREFFADPKRNKKLKEILGDFPDIKEVYKLSDDKIKQLHIYVIKKFLQDVYLTYRINLLKWSEVTRQSAIVDPEYLSMHLVSIFTGIPGTGTAARGLDLADGSEVKSCSRAEQLGRCKKCGAPVMPYEEKCGNCESTDIERKFDSHWIFSLRSEEEVKKLLSVPAIYLVLFDYEDIKKRDVVRVRIWKLDPKDKFVKVFFYDHYFKEFYEKKRQQGQTPAPCNLHPEKPLTKSLKPKLLFVAKIDLNKFETIIELVDSEGIIEGIEESEIKELISKRKAFFKKIKELGLEKEYIQRLKELSSIKNKRLTEYF